MTRVAGPIRRRTSSVLPTAEMRPSRTATACASDRSGSTVHTRALMMTSSAFGAVPFGPPQPATDVIAHMIVNPRTSQSVERA